MTLREPRSDETYEKELQRLGLKREGELIDTGVFIPFLCIRVMSNGDESHFVIDGGTVLSTDIDKNNVVTQTFTWIGHKASEEEIKKFTSEGEE